VRNAADHPAIINPVRAAPTTGQQRLDRAPTPHRSANKVRPFKPPLFRSLNHIHAQKRIA
jgi:hypothetical protein